MKIAIKSTPLYSEDVPYIYTCTLPWEMHIISSNNNILKFFAHFWFCFVGCHVIAPSDMMDNRVGAIKDILHQNGFGGKVRMKLKGSSLGKGLSAFVRVLKHCLSQTGKDPFTVT